jgi:hypothetical protein
MMPNYGKLARFLTGKGDFPEPPGANFRGGAHKAAPLEAGADRPAAVH